LARFLITGVGANLLFLLLSYAFVRGSVAPFWASMAAYAIAFVVSYLAQRNWTFEARHRHARSLPRYFVLQLGCATLSGGLAEGAVRVVGLPPLAMAVFTAGVVGLISYVLSSTWVFPDAQNAK
jgi:putative flippase GtrA